MRMFEKIFRQKGEQTILLIDKDDHLIRILDAPSPSLGRTFRDKYGVGFVSIDANCIYASLSNEMVNAWGWS